MNAEAANYQPSLRWMDEEREGISLRELEEVQIDGINCLVEARRRAFAPESSEPCDGLSWLLCIL